MILLTLGWWQVEEWWRELAMFPEKCHPTVSSFFYEVGVFVASDWVSIFFLKFYLKEEWKFHVC